MEPLNFLGNAGDVGIIVVAIILLVREIRPFLIKSNGKPDGMKFLCPIEISIKDSLVDILNNQTKILDRMEERQTQMCIDIAVMKNSNT